MTVHERRRNDGVIGKLFSSSSNGGRPRKISAGDTRRLGLLLWCRGNRVSNDHGLYSFDADPMFVLRLICPGIRQTGVSKGHRLFAAKNMTEFLKNKSNTIPLALKNFEKSATQVSQCSQILELCPSEASKEVKQTMARIVGSWDPISQIYRGGGNNEVSRLRETR